MSPGKRKPQRPARTSARFDGAAMCPCGTGTPYGECCGRIHAGTGTAATAEQLMRSRFTAFAVGDAGYLLHSWHPDTRPASLTLDAAQVWTRLEIVGRTGGGLLDAEGTVDFRAHYTELGEAEVMHENSAFARSDGRWVYVGRLGPRAGSSP